MPDCAARAGGAQPVAPRARLEKAIALKLPDDELDALRARVRLAVAYHAQSALDGNEPALRPRPYVDTRRWPPWRRSRETVGLRRRAKAGDGASLDGGG